MAGRTRGGLTEQQVQEIGAELDNGGKPKVVLRESSSGLPAGTVGVVVRLGDPAESEEFVVVRIHNDDLPFTPVELEPAPPRARRPRQPDSDRAASADAPARTSSALVAAADGTALPATVAATVKSAPAPVSVPVSEPASTSVSEPAVRPTARADSGRKGSAKRVPPKLTVQLHYDERGWTVEASRGARALVKPTPVRPAAALQVAHFLDNEQVSQAIADIAQAEREEAARKAAELRAQLAEVEAVLAGYDEA